MKKLTMIAMVTLILGTLGTVVLAGSGSGHEDDGLDLDKITELKTEAVEKDAELVEKIAEATVEGDFEKIAALEEKRIEVATDLTEDIMDEEMDELDEVEIEDEDLLEDLEDIDEIEID